MCLQARHSLTVERCALTRCCSGRISPDWMKEVKLGGMFRDVESKQMALLQSNVEGRCQSGRILGSKLKLARD